MRRNWNARYDYPAELMYDAIMAVGIALIIGFVSVMMFDVKGYGAKAAKKFRWIGVGIGTLAFVAIWGLAMLLFHVLPIRDQDLAEKMMVGLIIALDIALCVFCTIKKKKLNQ